jgi:hypothetical protein
VHQDSCRTVASWTGHHAALKQKGFVIVESANGQNWRHERQSVIHLPCGSCLSGGAPGFLGIEHGQNSIHLGTRIVAVRISNRANRPRAG